MAETVALSDQCVCVCVISAEIKSVANNRQQSESSQVELQRFLSLSVCIEYLPVIEPSASDRAAAAARLLLQLISVVGFVVDTHTHKHTDRRWLIVVSK